MVYQDSKSKFILVLVLLFWTLIVLSYEVEASKLEVDLLKLIRVTFFPWLNKLLYNLIQTQKVLKSELLNPPSSPQGISHNRISLFRSLRKDSNIQEWTYKAFS